VQKAIKEMRDKKATRDDDVLGNGLRMSEKDCMKDGDTVGRQKICSLRVAQGFH
jgi:hypothetical protein